MTRWCPECGDSHECAADLAGDDDKTRIQLARIEADRDIRIAELQAGEVKDEAKAAVEIAAADAEHEAARAEGEAAGMETVIEAATGGSEPVIIDTGGAGPEELPEEPPEDTPAPPETEPVHSGGRSGGGYWSGYPG